VAEVLEMAYQMFALLLGQAVGIALVTKGRIPERHMELLCARPELVRAQIGVITPDEALARRLEPNAAPPSVRFEQTRQLIHAGIKTRIRVAPIIPGLTDAAETLDALFGHAASAGVERATINALHLRPAIVASLRKHLERHEAEEVLCRYAGAQSVRVCGGKSRQTPLSATARIALFERARRIAKNHGIQAHMCGCMNPDLTNERCALAGDWPVSDLGQMNLFQG
jgi:DNA repair photolyase